MSQLVDNPIKPTSIDADFFINKAIEYHQLNNLETAIRYAELALTCAPESDQYLHTLAVLHQHNKNLDQSVEYFEKAISINTSSFTYHFNLGIVYKDLGRPEESLKTQTTALTLEPNNLLCLNEVGLLLTGFKQFSDAEKTFLKAHQLDSNHISTCINLSHLYIQTQQVRETIDFANKAMLLDPHRPEPYCNIGTAFMIANCYEEGVQYLRLSLNKHSKDEANIHQSMLMNMLYSDAYSPEEIFNEHKQWADKYLQQKVVNDTQRYRGNEENKILNIGFISSDFQNHSISHFLVPLFESFNHQRYRLHCYTTSNVVDKVTLQLKQQAASWHNLSHYDDETKAQKIQQDEIDILIDLAGHSLGSNIAVFAQKPAPIQMTYLGYPFSSGLTSMDYRITDDFTDPGESTAHLHTEKLLKISPSFICYKPEKPYEIDASPPMMKNKFVTFGSFNNLSKLSNLTIQLWANILNEVDGATILLKSTHVIPDGLRDTILSTFENFGVHHHRVILHHPTATKAEHFALYNRVDIGLDSTPYNGTTTTYEAIYMGIPVITLLGKAHLSRVGGGILTNLGLNELIANDENDYLNIATQLAKTPLSLTEYRTTLRNRLLTSPLTDQTSYTRKFEQLLQSAWHTYCDKQSYSL